MGLQYVLCMQTVLCAAVGTASHQHGSEAMYHVSGKVLQHVQAVPNIPAANKLVKKIVSLSFSSPTQNQTHKPTQ
jgi:hypothetical protein